MGAKERGFTLVELVIAVGISVMLLVAGGVWMLGMRPAALRSAADDFDANLAAARTTAGGSGNGATVAFLPRVGTPGFIMRVYSGRPTASGAVTTTNVMDVTSGATLSEATFGVPPFAIFLNSGGYATGMSHYPSVATDGSVSFPVIAQQPPCPAGGIVLTFANAQGATDTRTLPCNTMLGGTSTADPSPTPNAPKVAPSFMLAHWTSDAGPLHFIAAEFGYFHWYASAIGDTCATQASDTGAAPAVFASGWPYSAPSSPSELTLAPSAPSAPYSWPNGDPNDPPALFRLSPVVHNGGLCTVRIVDDYNQETDARVQVMGDLQSSATSLTFASPTDASATVTFGKTFDSEALKLQAGATACANVVSVEIPAAPTPQASPSTAPTQATIVVTPIAAGSCTLIVGDQYGEPTLSIPITVKAAQSMATWPQVLTVGVSGAALGVTSSGVLADGSSRRWNLALGSVINALLAGGVARASGSPCYALAQTSTGAPDTSIFSDTAGGTALDAATGIAVDTSGCEVSYPSLAPVSATAAGAIAYEPGGAASSFTDGGSCFNLSFLWSPNPPNNLSSAVLGAQGSAPGSCAVTLDDTANTGAGTADKGLVSVVVVGCSIAGGYVPVGQSCTFTTAKQYGECAGADVPSTPAAPYFSDEFATWNGAIATPQIAAVNSGPPDGDLLDGGSGHYSDSGLLGTLTTQGYSDSTPSGWTTITFARSAPGPATFYVYDDTVVASTHPLAGDVVCTGAWTLSSPVAVTIN